MDGCRPSSAPYHSAKCQAAQRGTSDVGPDRAAFYFTPRLTPRAPHLRLPIPPPIIAKIRNRPELSQAMPDYNLPRYWPLETIGSQWRPAGCSARQPLGRRLIVVIHRYGGRQCFWQWSERSHIDDPEAPSRAITDRTDIHATDSANQEICRLDPKSIALQGTALNGLKGERSGRVRCR
jgi:hypothetical protein